jgi:dissimilatory sulfite reductase (desulfoviridin) alpha/beta subunit
MCVGLTVLCLLVAIWMWRAGWRAFKEEIARAARERHHDRT